MQKNDDIENAELGWEEAVVMVCTNCGKRLEKSSLLESPKRIKSELKSLVKSQLGKKVRVVTSSCLNICPKDKIAIVVAWRNDPETFKAYAVEPNVSSEVLFRKIIKTKPS